MFGHLVSLLFYIYIYLQKAPLFILQICEKGTSDVKLFLTTWLKERGTVPFQPTDLFVSIDFKWLPYFIPFELSFSSSAFALKNPD